ncbi:MAG: nucleotidyltransferase family protein [Gemmatimonadaceae bacterium]|jgi:hypothetical protein|nr:nucleotidyltransferase family protein [Gemmatimonadaceae bacterium]
MPRPSLLAPLDRAAAWRLLAPSARLVVASVHEGAAAGALPWGQVQPATLLTLVQQERCEGAMLALATQAPPGAVPPTLVEALRAQARVASFRAAGLAEGAQAAVDALATAGIESVWLKGAGLAMAAGDTHFVDRPMGDVDVLVAPDAIPAAQAALRGAGWVPGPDEGAYADAGHHHGAAFTWRGDPAVRLELHRAVWPPPSPFRSPPVADWVGAGRAVRWRDRTVVVPSPAWALAHAATHWAWSHEGATGSWQWLRDARRLAATTTPDALSAAADRFGARRPIGWALHVARLLGALAPDSAVAAAASWRGAAGGVGGALAERQWVVRAFAAGPPTPGVSWDRYWYRRSLPGLGAPPAAWPWAAGFGQVPALAWTARGGGVGARVARWGGYVGRLRGLP